MRRSVILCVVFFGLVSGFVLGQDQAPDELYVPIVINGMVTDDFHYQTVFRFLEVSGTTATPAVSVAAELFDDDGKKVLTDSIFCPPPVPSADQLVHVELWPLGSLHLGTKGFVGSYEPQLGIYCGWMRIRAKGPGALAASAEILGVAQRPSGCPPVICLRPSELYKSDALVPAIRPAKRFRAPVVITEFRQSAFSIVNPSETETAEVVIEFFDSAGKSVRGGNLSVPPLSRDSRFAAEYALVPPAVPIPGQIPPPLPEAFYGSVRIRTINDVPIVVGGLQVLLPEGRLEAASVTAEK